MDNASTTIRDATHADAPACAAIYAPYVDETVISFEETAPDAAELQRRIEGSTCWLVAERDGRVVGYAYAGQFSSRAAYRYSQEVSIYLDRDARGGGIGGALLDAMLEHLRGMDMAQAFAGVTLPNPASVGLFESRGFAHVGTYRRVGFKRNAWHDVGWWQLELREP